MNTNLMNITDEALHLPVEARLIFCRSGSVMRASSSVVGGVAASSRAILSASVKKVATVFGSSWAKAMIRPPLGMSIGHSEEACGA